jgi:hypothetical protein
MVSIPGSRESSGNLRVEVSIVADSVKWTLCDRSSEQERSTPKKLFFQ